MPTILTPTELLERVKAEQARRSLMEFIRQAWHIVEPGTAFCDGWHLHAITEHLEAVTRGDIRNLLINIPPRCMKSLTVAVFWPCWVWASQPQTCWLFASYALSLAIRDSVKCRRLIESPWYQQHYGDIVQMTPDQNQKSRFETTARGYRYALSVGSGVTGEGGDVLCIDDPHNAVDAPSDAIRQGTLDWWDQAMSMRFNDPKTGRRVIVMQRLHADDMSAHVLAQGGWEHLNLPMEYEPERRCITSIGWADPRTAEGELLWPERIGQREIERYKQDLGTYGYAGQMQQRPVPKEGGTFKLEWMRRRYRELPKLTRIVQVVDSAFKEGVASDYSVIGTWGTDSVDYYLMHIWRARVAFPELVQAIKDQFARFHPRAVCIEDKASGQSAIQVLRRETSLPVIPIPADGTKESRADTVSPLFEAGKVVLPEAAEWLDAWIDEHVNFPRAAHDDQVDVTGYALRYFIQHDASHALAYMQQWQALTTERRNAIPPEHPIRTQ